MAGSFIQLFRVKNTEKAYFDQYLECAAPKRWSKYTTTTPLSQSVSSINSISNPVELGFEILNYHLIKIDLPSATANCPLKDFTIAKRLKNLRQTSLVVSFYKWSNKFLNSKQASLVKKGLFLTTF